MEKHNLYHLNHKMAEKMRSQGCARTTTTVEQPF
uniref:Uncharacterized protein n=1 Tax=Arundo donax TaxID=35708 RepID=A0A0A8ZK20_ARUDO